MNLVWIYDIHMSSSLVSDGFFTCFSVYIESINQSINQSKTLESANDRRAMILCDEVFRIFPPHGIVQLDKSFPIHAMGDPELLGY